jgi:DNA polymerase III subunit alpha
MAIATLLPTDVMADFTHLHVHSHFTLLESPITVARLLKAVKAKGMDAVALTDRGNLFAAYELYSQAKDAGITAIIGCQVNVAPLGMREKVRDWHQLVLLASNEIGYRNLGKLVSKGWLEGFYFEPRVDLEAIAAHAEGLVCLTGAGRDGFLNRHLMSGATEEAARQLGLLKGIFGPERLFVELTDHGGDGTLNQIAANCALADAAGVGVVATNWVHYLEASDHDIHDVQLAIQKVTTVDDTHRKRMPSREYYLKTPDEMAALFAARPDAISNTRRIVELCKGSKVPTGTYFLPSFPCPDGHTEETWLRELCARGIRKRYGDNPGEEVKARLAFELETILKMGFAAYFLIVADFINWAKDRGIPVGPGRGSAAGSIVAYAMGITDMCPLTYGLLFERFLNPGRKSMPDIDIDFCKDRRGEVIEYVANKYGHDAVTQIMTLGTMKARMAIKDVARAYHWTPEEAQELASLVPEDPSGKHDLQVCLGRKPLDKDKNEFGTVDAMLKRYESDERTRKVLDAALQLEKLGRSLGVHACGMIIAPGPVADYVPVCKVKDKAATQFNMTQVEKCGLLKMDFLGLKTMSILKKAADIAKDSEGIDIDYGKVPLDDPKTFAMLGTGRTLGVFQCESSGFQELIKLLKPDRFEDLIALVALYRPGPLMAGMHTQYCDRKHGRELVDYPHPVLEGVLKETYGLYIYQEQVMSISRELCGFTPAEADDLRKAMGKKDINVLKKLEEKFIEGAWTNHQFDRKKCKEMWEKILGFASYCFNKSHSACYGLIAYWTAYMKANHYAAFMTANLIYEMDNKDKMTKFVEELRSSGIPVLPPDVNESGWEFRVIRKKGPEVQSFLTATGGPEVPAKPSTGAGRAVGTVLETPGQGHSESIRFGFGGVKAVGEGAAQAIISERNERGPFQSLYDLCERIDTRTVNKRVVESLIKVGALDSLHPNRKALFDTQDRAFDRGNRLTRTKAQNQQTLFSTFEEDDSFRNETRGYPDVADWTVAERLSFEKALTGYWISSHPVTEQRRVLAGVATHTTNDLAAEPNGTSVAIAAVVLEKRVIRTKTGRSMAILTLEDQFGRFEAVLFPGREGRRGESQAGAFEKFAHDCEPDVVALFCGTLERRERRPQRQTVGGDDSEAPTGEMDEGGDAAETLPNLRVNDMIPASLAVERLTREVVLHLDTSAYPDPSAQARLLQASETILKEHAGARPVSVLVHTPQDVLLTLTLGETWRVHPSNELLEKLRRTWGAENVRTVSAGLEELQRSEQRGSHARAG